VPVGSFGRWGHDARTGKWFWSWVLRICGWLSASVWRVSDLRTPIEWDPADAKAGPIGSGAASRGSRPGRRLTAWVALGVALLAGVALLLRAPDRSPAPAGRVSVAVAWPAVQGAELPGNLSDGPVFQPLYFVDARTAVGTAPSPDGSAVRLVITGAAVRELRRRPLSSGPEFNNLTVAGDTLVWTESVAGRPVEVWTAGLSGGAPRRLTADTGDAVFYGSQYDLVVADGRVYWVAAAKGGTETEIRSVALTGGAVSVRDEPGTWALTAWPWVVDGGPDNPGATRLRSLLDNRETRVPGTGLTTCGPVWCRVMVMASAGLVGIDLMHPDGTARRRVAGSAAGAAVTDVALLDRFAVLSESEPGSDLTGTSGLLVYDLKTGRTVDVGAVVSGVFARGGVLWWSTGDQDNLRWHTLDLRTV